MIIYKQCNGFYVSESRLKHGYEQTMKGKPKDFSAYVREAIESGSLSIVYKRDIFIDRVFTSRRAYKSLELNRGAYFGRDASGSFAWELVCKKRIRQSGPLPTKGKPITVRTEILRLWRFDPMRGWYKTWEENDTTKALVFLALTDDTWRFVRYESDVDGEACLCGEIKNDNGVNHMGSYIGKPRYSSKIGFSTGKGEIRTIGTPALIGASYVNGSKYVNNRTGKLITPPSTGI